MRAIFEIDHLIIAATNKAEKCRQEWHEAHLELIKDIEECKIAHTTPPSNYWVSEARLKGKYQLSIQLLQSLMEIKEEQTK